jgi:hypothetical protein
MEEQVNEDDDVQIGSPSVGQSLEELPLDKALVEEK